MPRVPKSLVLWSPLGKVWTVGFMDPVPLVCAQDAAQTWQALWPGRPPLLGWCFLTLTHQLSHFSNLNFPNHKIRTQIR